MSGCWRSWLSTEAATNLVCRTPEPATKAKTQMKAVMKLAPGPGHVGLGQVPEPVAGPGQVKIAVAAAGICGTDLHIEADEYRNRPPVVLGHECAGVVAEVGSGVTTVAAGQRVTALPYAVQCGRCTYCRQGQYPLCSDRAAFGSGVDGAFAPYLVIPADIVRPLPEHVDLECGALSEPLACCVKAVQESATIRAGDLVVVVGPGPIGLLALQLVKLQGATAVLLGTAQDAHRLALGRDLGADLALQADADDLWSALGELSRGEGADVVLECAGVPAATRTALRAVRKRGQLVQMGLHGRPFELDFEQIVYKDLRVIGSFASSATSWDRALALLANGSLQLRPLISAVLPLEEWEQAFAMVRRREGLKVLLRPGG